MKRLVVLVIRLLPLLPLLPLLLSTMAVGPCQPQEIGNTGPGASDCFGSLAEVGPRCPATFDGTAAQLPKCQDLPYVQSAYNCSDAVVVAQSGGYVGDNCYYDPASHVLVGADRFSDVPSFCNDTSHSQSAGQIPDVAACLATTTPSVQRRCVDFLCTYGGTYRAIGDQFPSSNGCSLCTCLPDTSVSCDIPLCGQPTDAGSG